MEDQRRKSNAWRSKNVKGLGIYELKISKTEFKKDVMDNCRRLFRKEFDEATPRGAVSVSILCSKGYDCSRTRSQREQLTKDDPKIVYYMSMEDS